MRIELGIVVLFLGLALGVVVAQDKGGGETKTTATPKITPPTHGPDIPIENMWRFTYEGKQRKGDFLQLADPQDEVGRGRHLVITQMEIRMRQTMRARLVVHTKLPKSGKWKKEMVRSELFSVGWLDTTSKYMASGYGSFLGIRVNPDQRPSLEFRQGGGDLAVYAEGYWVGEPKKVAEPAKRK